MGRFGFVVRMIGSSIRLTFLGIRFTLPWVVRALFVTLFWMVRGLLGVIGGVPATCEKLAEYWVDQAHRKGFPSLYDDALYYIVYWVAWIDIIVGWLLIALLTTAAISWLL